MFRYMNISSEWLYLRTYYFFNSKINIEEVRYIENLKLDFWNFSSYSC